MAKQSLRDAKIDVTEEQKEILLGILLGDGHMELSPNGKSARLKIEQEGKKLDYVAHLHKVFLDWGAGLIVPATNSNNFKFSTAFSPTLVHYHTSFYGSQKPGERQIPRWIEHSFTARSLAYLIMDDGGIKSKQSKGLNINVYSLPKEEQEFLCNILERKFRLKAKVAKDRDRYRIYISGESYEELVALISDHILPCVRYKIPPPRKKPRQV